MNIKKTGPRKPQATRTNPVLAQPKAKAKAKAKAKHEIKDLLSESVTPESWISLKGVIKRSTATAAGAALGSGINFLLGGNVSLAGSINAALIGGIVGFALGSETAKSVAGKLPQAVREFRQEKREQKAAKAQAERHREIVEAEADRLFQKQAKHDGETAFRELWATKGTQEVERIVQERLPQEIVKTVETRLAEEIQRRNGEIQERVLRSLSNERNFPKEPKTGSVPPVLEQHLKLAESTSDRGFQHDMIHQGLTSFANSLESSSDLKNLLENFLDSYTVPVRTYYNDAYKGYKDYGLNAILPSKRILSQKIPLLIEKTNDGLSLSDVLEVADSYGAESYAQFHFLYAALLTFIRSPHQDGAQKQLLRPYSGHMNWSERTGQAKALAKVMNFVSKNDLTKPATYLYLHSEAKKDDGAIDSSEAEKLMANCLRVISDHGHLTAPQKAMVNSVLDRQPFFLDSVVPTLKQLQEQGV